MSNDYICKLYVHVHVRCPVMLQWFPDNFDSFVKQQHVHVHVCVLIPGGLILAFEWDTDARCPSEVQLTFYESNIHVIAKYCFICVALNGFNRRSNQYLLSTRLTKATLWSLSSVTPHPAPVAVLGDKRTPPPPPSPPPLSVKSNSVDETSLQCRVFVGWWPVVIGTHGMLLRQIALKVTRAEVDKII